MSLLRSVGGLISAEESRTAPVNLLMSGPAGGVAGQDNEAIYGSLLGLGCEQFAELAARNVI